MDSFDLFTRLWNKRPFWLLPLLIVLVYSATRLIGLNSLPVFADEAIYIRWAQLFRHDPAQYAFFSMNDGKPPLFIWLLAAVLPFSPSDPVFIGRILSAVVGLLQLVMLDRVLRALGGSPLARAAQAVLVIVVPFWLLHHRLALMDGLLTLALTLSLWGLVRLHAILTPSKVTSKDIHFSLVSPASLVSLATLLRPNPALVLGTLAAGAGWGLALMTKTPALFFAPTFLWWSTLPVVWPLPKERTAFFWSLLQRSFWFGLAGVLGGLLFLTLKIHPAFGSLFGRSTDFTYTLSEVIAQPWVPLLANVPRITAWLSQYMRPELLSFCLIALLVSRQKRTHWLLLGSSLLFLAPFLILGKTLHARYLLPAVIGFTLSASLFFAEAWENVKQTRSTELWIVSVLLLLFFFLGSLRFTALFLLNPSQTPFVLDDREQYLTSWASGHGIPQVRDLLLQEVAQGRYVTVVTEGSFGTLPDGLLLYFDQRPEIRSLRIEGLAQFPVRTIPDWVYAEAAKHPTWLLVNENRMAVDLTSNPLKLKARFERPYAGPELHVYEVLPRVAQ